MAAPFFSLPLTSDHAAFRLFLDAASTDDLGDPATDLGGAFATAAKVFEHEGERGHRAILVVSDGESGEGGMDEALQQLRKEEVPVFALGIGTAQGGPIPADSSELPDKFHRDHIGRIAVSRLEEAELRHAAEATGGAFARWDNREARARLALALGKLEAGALSSRKSPERADRFQWPLALAVIALLAELALASVRGRRRVAVSRRGDRCGGDGVRSRRVRRRGEASEATPTVNLPPRPPPSRRRLPPTARRSTRSAPETHSTACVTTRTPPNVIAGLSPVPTPFANEGHSTSETPSCERRRMRRSDRSCFVASIQAYQEALRLAPSDADAKWNLEIALRRLSDDRLSGGLAWSHSQRGLRAGQHELLRIRRESGCRRGRHGRRRVRLGGGRVGRGAGRRAGTTTARGGATGAAADSRGPAHAGHEGWGAGLVGATANVEGCLLRTF